MTAANEDVSGSDRSETGDTRRWRTFAIAGAVATLLIAAAITLAVMFVAAQSEVHTFTIPEGTQERIDRGEYMDLFPETLRVEVGDELVIDNQDTVTHQFGPYAARAGERLVVHFSQTGTFPGPCSVNDSKSTEVIVED